MKQVFNSDNGGKIIAIALFSVGTLALNLMEGRRFQTEKGAMSMSSP